MPTGAVLLHFVKKYAEFIDELSAWTVKELGINILHITTREGLTQSAVGRAGYRGEHMIRGKIIPWNNWLSA